MFYLNVVISFGSYTGLETLLSSFRSQILGLRY